MRKKLVVIFLSLISTFCFAQEAVVPAGGDATGSGGSLSYSVGQVVYTVISDQNNSIVQGVQQPYEISVVISVAEVQPVNNVLLYPNPTVNEVALCLNFMEGLYYRIIDIKGTFMESRMIMADQTIIDMSRYSPSTYLFELIQNNKTIQTYQIVKN
jgi:hypothetical protein